MEGAMFYLSAIERSWGGKLGLAIASLCAITFSTNRANAQITPDGTLPDNSRVITQDNLTTIEAGTIEGSNLFHSFKDFSVPTGSTAYFNNAPDIQNIISRVTGGSISNIDGLIRANGTANLFLLNPNGIIFGPNAQLNIGGSFLASTANSLKFADGIEFSATTPQSKPLLTISVPIGLQYGANPERILVQGNGQGKRITTELIDTDFGLRVPANQTLALVGGEVVLEGATLKTAGGRIELGSVASPDIVRLTPSQNGFSLSYEGVSTFGDIQLSQQSAVDASGEGAGDIQVRGRRLLLRDGSTIETLTLGSKPGGTFNITASESVELIGSKTLANGRKVGSLLSARTYGAGSAGSLSITTGRLSLQDGSQVTASTHSEGQAGQVTVNAYDSVQVIGESEDGEIATSLRATVESEATGDGGNLYVETKQLIVQGGAEVTSGNFGAGKAGNVSIRAKEVRVIGTSAKYGGQYPSYINANVNRQATGEGGNVNIQTEQLFVEDGAQIGAGTLGIGDAGILNVHASDLVKVSGRSKDNRSGSQLGAKVNQYAIGKGGNLTIDTKRLIVQDGAQISTGTSGKGSAGNLRVNSLNSVELIGAGTNADGQVVSSGIFSEVNQGATGSGGNITIKTGRLIIRDGAEVGSGAFGNGPGGTVEVTASESVELFGRPKNGTRSFVFSDTFGAEAAGKITIATKRLVIQDGAEVSASTYGSGSGGTVEVTASESMEVIGTTANGEFPSTLSAATLAIGNAGDLTIKTGQLNVRDGAEITVSSIGSGKAGNLKVQARSIKLDNQGAVISTTKSGNGGNIELQAQDLLLLRRNSNISTSAGTAQAGGNGGNIIIDSPFIVAVPRENSDITANAFSGSGGTVAINATNIFGMVVRSREDLVRLLSTNDPIQLDTQKLLTSDISAISQASPTLSGQVNINTPDVDPSRGLAELPAEVVDASGLIAQGCNAQNGKIASQFTIIGRGGLPPNPSELLSSDAVWEDARRPSVMANRQNLKTATQPSEASAGVEIVPADSWKFNNKGEVVLTAQAVNTPQTFTSNPTTCRVP
jgi:filamentous hemagglutinin family protein